MTYTVYLYRCNLLTYNVLNNDGSSGLSSAEQPGMEKIDFLNNCRNSEKTKNKKKNISTCLNGDDNNNKDDITTSGRNIG